MSWSGDPLDNVSVDSYVQVVFQRDLFGRALERIVREDHEGGAGWMAAIAQEALDSAAFRGSQRDT